MTLNLSSALFIEQPQLLSPKKKNYGRDERLPLELPGLDCRSLMILVVVEDAANGCCGEDLQRNQIITMNNFTRFEDTVKLKVKPIMNKKM